LTTAISAGGGRRRNHTECDDVELIVVDDESTDEPTRVQERNNLARILAVKVHDDGTRAIPQAIFADDDLVIKVHPRHETFKLSNARAMNRS
jgi:glycosyltransferase involved in cell wall biosynthesis